MIIEQAGSLACSATAVKKILITCNFVDLFEIAHLRAFALRSVFTGKNEMRNARKARGKTPEIHAGTRVCPA